MLRKIVDRIKSHSRSWRLGLAILLGVALIISCRPADELKTSQPVAEEAATVELEPAPPETGELATLSETTPSETEEPPSEEPITDLSDIVHMDPAEVDNSDLPITPIEKLHLTGSVPEVDINEYRLVIDGLVETPLSLSYEDLLSYPTVTEVVLLICRNIFADNAGWSGIPLRTLLAEAGVNPEATEVTFWGLDEFRMSMPLETAEQDGVFLAHTVNGQVLPAEHGYPLRAVARGVFGAKWVKWLERIEVS